MQASRFLFVVLGLPRLMLCACAIVDGVNTSAQANGTNSSPACFIVALTSPRALQLRVPQPVDLEVSVTILSDSARVRVDGFEFGEETITLTKPGRYTVEVKPTLAGTLSAYVSTMTAGEMSLHEAERWIELEHLSTFVKQSGDKASAEGALAKWQQLKSDAGTSRLHLALGDIVLRTGDLAGARSSYESARSICIKRKDQRCLAEASNNSGMVARRLGDIETSASRLKEAVDSWNAISETGYAGRTLSNLGLLQWQSGDYQNALTSYSEAMRLLRNKDPIAYGRVLNNLGLTYISLAEYGRAIAILRSALREYNRPALKSEVSIARANLGWAYLRQGRFAIARVTLETALREAIRQKNKFAELSALANVGEVYRRLKLRNESRVALQKALQLSQIIHDKQFEGLAAYQLGILSGDEGEADTARKMLQQSLEVRRGSRERDAESETLFALARLANTTGKPEEARMYAEDALRVLESLRSQISTAALRASYYSRKRAVFDLLLDQVMARRAEESAQEGLLLVERTRGRALLDLLTSESSDGATKALADEQVRIQRQITFLSMRIRRGDAESQATRDKIEILLAENDALEAQIRASVRNRDLAEPVDNLADLQRRLPPDSALIEFHLGDEKGYIWVVRRSGAPWVFPVARRAIVDSLAMRVASEFDNIIDRRRSRDKQAAFVEALRLLSRTVLGPLAEIRLPRRLIFSLDGALHEVPLAALTMPGSAKPLGIDHELLQISSGSLLAHIPFPRIPKSFPKTALVIADPVFSSFDSRVTAIRTAQTQESGLRLRRLPFTAEVDTLTAGAPASRVDVLRGFEANSSSLHRRRLEDYAVLHLSTHTLIDDEEPQMSHIALSMIDQSGLTSSGLLRPQHLSRWRLQSSLVVLASCETALGKRVIGEGLVGFTGALFSAGASQLIMSTSKVDAEASSEFFTHFYRNYLAESTPSAERSLRIARQQMASSPRWADPYYWAAFTVIGQVSGKN